MGFKQFITFLCADQTLSSGIFFVSIDMHMQCSFQLLRPESLAILCIPQHHE